MDAVLPTLRQRSTYHLHSCLTVRSACPGWWVSRARHLCHSMDPSSGQGFVAPVDSAMAGSNIEGYTEDDIPFYLQYIGTFL